MTQPITTHHGNLLVINEIGTLIIGKPGIGKSELSLALIDRGHPLVADDAVDIKIENDVLVGSCPDPIKGFMQIDHVGTINIIKLYGEKVYQPQHTVDIVVTLEIPEKPTKPEHALKPTITSRKMLSCTVPCYHLPLYVGKQLPILVEVLVKNYKLNQHGYDAYKDLTNKQQNLMRR